MRLFRPNWAFFEPLPETKTIWGIFTEDLFSVLAAACGVAGFVYIVIAPGVLPRILLGFVVTFVVLIFMVKAHKINLRLSAEMQKIQDIFRSDIEASLRQIQEGVNIYKNFLSKEGIEAALQKIEGLLLEQKAFLNVCRAGQPVRIPVRRYVHHGDEIVLVSRKKDFPKPDEVNRFALFRFVMADPDVSHTIGECELHQNNPDEDGIMFRLSHIENERMLSSMQEQFESTHQIDPKVYQLRPVGHDFLRNTDLDSIEKTLSLIGNLKEVFYVQD